MTRLNYALRGWHSQTVNALNPPTVVAAHISQQAVIAASRAGDGFPTSAEHENPNAK
jgi:hypothetical protein